MNTSRKLILSALAFLVLALLSFLFSKGTILGMIRQRSDERAADAYLAVAVRQEESGTEKTTNDKSKSDQEPRTEEPVPEMAIIEDYDKNKIITFAVDEWPIRSEEIDETAEGTLKDLTEERASSASEDTMSRIAAPISEPSYSEIEDNAYYERGGTVYTPDHAVGRIDCVLEIPKISLKRCVYSGTDQEIAEDLDMWFTVSASGTLIPGETHYAIFGHNHTVQNLSFNRLGEVTVGDWFTLTSGGEVLIYVVTDILAMDRASGRAAFAYDDSLDPSLCYIFTCGRDHILLNGVSTRYKDLIVEGTLWKTVPARIWQGLEENESESEALTREDQTEDEPEDLLGALQKEAMKIRREKPAPILTAASKEGPLSTDGPVGSTSFSWSMMLVILTALFSLACVGSFVSCIVWKIAHKKEAAPGGRGHRDLLKKDITC